MRLESRPCARYPWESGGSFKRVRVDARSGLAHEPAVLRIEDRARGFQLLSRSRSQMRASFQA